MKTTLLLSIILVIVAARKEETEDLDRFINSPGIWRYIRKRIGYSRNPNEPRDEEPKTVAPSTQSTNKEAPHDEETNHGEDDNRNHKMKDQPWGSRADSLGNLCPYKANVSLIIKTKASLQAGAFFLKSFPRVTAEQCTEYCCYTQNCNLAVYENKEEHDCYLFNCGSPSKCLFAKHANFSTVVFPSHGLPSVRTSGEPGQQKTHENELEGLDNEKTTTQQSTTASPTPPPRHTVALFGKCYIDWNDKCADPNSQCLDGQCKCMDGYKVKYGFCRKECEPSTFECENKGQNGNVPDCIDHDLVCDGTSQCADGSDERHCEVDAEVDKTKTLTKAKEHSEETDPDRTEDVLSTNGLASSHQTMSEPHYLLQSDGKAGYGGPQGTGLYNTMHRPVSNAGYGQQVAPDNVGLSNPRYQAYYWPQNANQPRMSNVGYRQPGYGPYSALSPYDQYQQQLGPYAGQESPQYNGRYNDNGMQNMRPVAHPNSGLPVHGNDRLDSGKGQDQNKYYSKDGSSMYPNYGRGRNYGDLMGSADHGASYDEANDRQSQAQSQKLSETTTVRLATTTPTTTTTQRTTTTATTTETTTTTTKPLVVTTTVKKADIDIVDNSNNYYSTWGRNKINDNQDEDMDHTSIVSKSRNRQKQFHKSQRIQEQQHLRNRGRKTQVQVQSPLTNKGDNVHGQRMPNGRHQVNKVKVEQGMNRVPIQNRQRIKTQKNRYPIYDDLGYGGRRYPYKWADYSNDYYYPDYLDQPTQDDRSYSHYDYGTQNKGGEVKNEPPKTHETDSNIDEQASEGEEEEKPSTEPSSRPGPPKDVKVVSKSTDEVRVEWEEAEASPCCPIMAYSIEFKKTNSDNVKKYAVQADTLSKVISNLEPNTSYTIYVRAYSFSSGASTRSEITVVTDASSVQQDKPENVSNNSSTSKASPIKLMTATPVPVVLVSSTVNTKTKPKQNNMTSERKGGNTVIVEEEVDKVLVTSPTDSNEGPIVALALGLGITLMLLVFVGCRLRTVKRRIRKGRALHSNEADYLINGMYL